MKKILCLILALMLVFSLAACSEASSGSDGEEETKPKKSWDVEDLVGTWKMEQTFTAEQMFHLSDAEGQIKVVMRLTFDEEGMVSFELDEDAMRAQEEELVVFVESALYASAANAGLSREEAEADVEETWGKSMKEYAKQATEEMLNSMVESVNQREPVPYTVEDKNLSFNDITYKFYIQGNKLVFEEVVEGEDAALELPMTLKRVKD